MKRAFDKVRKTRRRQSSVQLTCLAAGVALALSFAGAGPAYAEDSFDPLKGLKNLFSGEKYETKIVPDVPADDLYNQALARLQSKDYDGAAKKFAELDFIETVRGVGYRAREL